MVDRLCLDQHLEQKSVSLRPATRTDPQSLPPGDPHPGAGARVHGLLQEPPVRQHAVAGVQREDRRVQQQSEGQLLQRLLPVGSATYMVDIPADRGFVSRKRGIGAAAADADGMIGKRSSPKMPGGARP
eukprot:gene16676-biopygen10171